MGFHALLCEIQALKVLTQVILSFPTTVESFFAAAAIIVKLRSRSRSQVMSMSGPRSGPKGPRSKDQRPGPGLYTKFGLPLSTKLFLGLKSGRLGCILGGQVRSGLVQVTAQI
mgnify:CR=1 FL=1